jgi:hypothetical protein
MLRVFSIGTLRAMSLSSILRFPGRKKALTGPGTAQRDRPEASYVVWVSIDVGNRSTRPLGTRG